MRGYTRTYEVDTLRLGCPQQWRKAGADFENTSTETEGRYIGGLKASWFSYYLPLDENTKLLWKNHAPDVGVADWNWTIRYPRTPYLKNVWWDPFIMYVKEVPW